MSLECEYDDHYDRQIKNPASTFTFRISQSHNGRSAAVNLRSDDCHGKTKHEDLHAAITTQFAFKQVGLVQVRVWAGLSTVGGSNSNQVRYLLRDFSFICPNQLSCNEYIDNMLSAGRSGCEGEDWSHSHGQVKRMKSLTFCNYCCSRVNSRD